MTQGLVSHRDAPMRIQLWVRKVHGGREAQSLSLGNSELVSHYPTTPPTVHRGLIFSINLSVKHI